MVLAYLLIASDLSSPREYDVAEAFSGMMISVGFYATLLLLLLWIRELRHAGFAEMYIQPANNLGTFLLFALPFPLYFVSRANGWRKLIPASGFLLFFAALLLSTSRGAMVMAPVLALVSLVLFAIVDEEHRRGWIVSSVVLGVVCVGAAGVTLRFLVPDSPGANVFDDLSRLRLIRASMLDFREYPVFGAGLAGSRNTSAYQPVAGAMPVVSHDDSPDHRKHGERRCACLRVSDLHACAGVPFPDRGVFFGVASLLFRSAFHVAGQPRRVLPASV